MNDYQILQDIGRSKSAMVYKVERVTLYSKSCIIHFEIQDATALNHGGFIKVCIAGAEKEDNRVFRAQMCRQKSKAEDYA
jgi:hypothetical protein